MDEIHQGFLDKIGKINPQYANLLYRKGAISLKELEQNNKEYLGKKDLTEKELKQEAPSLDYQKMTNEEMKETL